MDREVAAAVESEVARNAEELEVELEAEPEPALAVENDDDEEDGDASPSAPQEGGGPVDALAQIRAGVLRLVDLCDSGLSPKPSRRTRSWVRCCNCGVRLWVHCNLAGWSYHCRRCKGVCIARGRSPRLRPSTSAHSAGGDVVARAACGGN